MYFSVIVPVYNIESYLKECLDSILTQSFNDYELILIDDGSTDNSGLIIEEYKQNYPDHIKVIYQENRGLSYTRNKGLEVASGDYIIFIDGDDYINPDSFSSFYEVLKGKKVDVLVTKLIEFFPDESIKYLDKELDLSLLNNLSKEEVINLVFNKSQSTWPAVRYIVNRKFMLESSISFKEKIYHEDIDYTPRLFLKADSFKGTNYHWYNHRMLRVGSINSTPNVKKVLDVINTISNHIENEMYNGLNESTRLIIFRRLNRSLYPSIKKYHLFNHQSKKQIILALKQNKHISKYSKKPIHKMFNTLCKVFGYKVGLSLTRFM